MSVQMEFMKRKFHSGVSKTEELQVFVETYLDFKGILKVFIMHVQLAAVGRLPYDASFKSSSVTNQGYWAVTTIQI